MDPLTANVNKSALWRLAAIDVRIREGQPVTARQLAGDLEVGVRTVYRDLEFLRDRLGAPLAYDPRRRSYVYTQPSWQLPAVKLTEGELIALFLAEKVLRQYCGTPYEHDIASAFDKVTRLLPDEVSISLGALTQLYSFRTSTTSLQDIAIFSQLVDAATLRRQVDIEYRTATDETYRTRRIDPYHLANVDGEWYLFAHCHTRDAVRIFRPDRIRSLRLIECAFDRPTDFDPSDHLDAALGVYSEGSKRHRVVLEFTPYAARFIREKIWHASQKLVELPDGSVRLELRLSSFVEIKRFALGWGRHCRAVHPKRFVREMREEVEAMGDHQVEQTRSSKAGEHHE